VYTVYNGGSDGAIVAKTALNVAPSPAPTPLWTAELYVSGTPADIHANNVSQLSAPYYNANSDTLYALKSSTTTVFAPANFLGWSAAGGAAVDSSTGAASFPAGTTSSISYSGTNIIPADVHTLNLQTNLNSGASTTSTYQIDLYDAAGTLLIQNLVPGGTSFSGTYGTYYTYNDNLILAGNYTIRITVSAGTTAATASTLSLGRYDWALYSLSSVSVATAAPTPVRIAYGEGQANTPISYDTDSNGRLLDLYWGVWGGTRSYYQYNLQGSTPAVISFLPKSSAGGDNFYWAGAALVTISGTNYAVFGSDSGTVYVQDTANFAVPGFSFLVPQASQIRSSIVSSGSYVYFTSADTTSAPALGYLWQITTSSLTAPSPSISIAKLTNASTSTPVISANGYVYVGTYNGLANGTVEAYPVSGISTNPIIIYGTPSTTPPTGDPVQSSAIVYSAGSGLNSYDYVYFTTNSVNGAGYAVSHRINTHAIASLWSVSGTSGNPYAVQGFAADNSYLVFGDDGNSLHILH
jgi:hypothetical protein